MIQKTLAPTDHFIRYICAYMLLANNVAAEKYIYIDIYISVCVCVNVYEIITSRKYLAQYLAVHFS